MRDVIISQSILFIISHAQIPVNPTFCTRDLKLCPDGSSTIRDPMNNCQWKPCKTDHSDPFPTETTRESTPMPFCTRDLKLCPDGKMTTRDPENNCDWRPCQETRNEPVFCTEEAKLCPDGSYTSRDPENNCEFKPCKKPSTRPCTRDLKLCSDGKMTSRDPENNCEWKPCDERPMRPCTRDVKFCPDGKLSVRDPFNNCEFEKCDENKNEIKVVPCTRDLKQCPDGALVTRDETKNCEWKPCPIEVKCDMTDRKKCRNGAIVRRDPGNNCKWKTCKKQVEISLETPNILLKQNMPCTRDLKKCWDGSYVHRNNEKSCRWNRCPKKACPTDTKKCKNGNVVERLLSKNCRFKSCKEEFWSDIEERSFDGLLPDLPPAMTAARPHLSTTLSQVNSFSKSRICSKHKKRCPGGEYVRKNPENHCHFDPCKIPERSPVTSKPEISPLGSGSLIRPFCHRGLKKCPDGTMVFADPANNCEFKPCEAAKQENEDARLNFLERLLSDKRDD